MKIKAKLKKILYQKDAYVVALYKNLDKDVIDDNNFTAFGSFLPTTEGMRVELSGDFVTNKKYGSQFRVDEYVELEPEGKNEIIGYILASGLTGIGNTKAERIYNTFGEDTIKILDENFTKICSVKGLPKDYNSDKVKLWQQRWKENRSLREAMKILSPNTGISTSAAIKIAKMYGHNLAERLEENPYDIIKIRGVSFVMADRLASKYNVQINDIRRIKAGIKFSLFQAMNAGHLFLTAKELLYSLYNMEDNKVKLFAGVDQHEVKLTINQMCQDGELSYTSLNNSCAIYLNANYINETYSSTKLLSLLDSKSSKKEWDDDALLNRLKDIEKSENITLANKQEEAVLNVFKYCVSIITGGPGRGKTTVINTIIDLYERVDVESNIVLMAPTGRAARRMSETTNHNASTIHSCLGLSAKDTNVMTTLDDEEVENIEADLIIIDESSMIDQLLMATLLKAINVGTRVVFVGDVDQLPSVGAGNVFKEMILSEAIPTTVLDVPFRQSEHDTIYKNSELINAGNTSLTFDSSFNFIECSGNDLINQKCIELYKKEFESMGRRKALEQLWLLTPFRKSTVIGSNELNKSLQAVINPPGADDRGFSKMELGAFRKYDKVMNLKNTNEVSNGDIGQISSVSINVDGSEESSVVIDFSSDIGQLIYEKSKLDELELAYASTIHKSQGSECDVIIIPLAPCFKPLLKRNLIYTAITRAKKKVYIVGDRDSLNKAICDNSYARRNTLLCARIIRDARERSISKNETTKQLEFNL